MQDAVRPRVQHQVVAEAEAEAEAGVRVGVIFASGAPAADFLRLPSNAVVELGSKVEI